MNLMNLIRARGNVLGELEEEISGVTVPWTSVGMQFSTFAWHTEDQYQYSINYNHTGAPKQWYGVPGLQASQFEEVFAKYLPNLSKKQPNILTMLVTQIPPYILAENGVTINRCLQKPGEFVVTFPQAYHAGFNHGYNVAEAVNFATADWFTFGFKSLSWYRTLRKKCTFS